MGTPEEALFDILQGTKVAGDTDVKTNEDDSTVGTTHIYDEPEDREPAGQSDSPWGEAGPTKDGNPDPVVYSSGARDQHRETRQGVIDTTFSSKPKSDTVEQKFIEENFAHGASGDFTTHSVHLQPKSVEKISHPRSSTLMEDVVKKLGRA